MRSLPHRSAPPAGLLTSKLYNEQTFYYALAKVLRCATNEVIIECPFITRSRMRLLLPELRKLTHRGITVVINTRESNLHDVPFDDQAADAISAMQSLGAEVLFTGNHHRKLVIIDRWVLYEGSLNVLSQNDSSEIMRRIESEELASEMIRFVGLQKFVG